MLQAGFKEGGVSREHDQQPHKQSGNWSLPDHQGAYGSPSEEQHIAAAQKHVCRARNGGAD